MPVKYIEPYNRKFTKLSVIVKQHANERFRERFMRLKEKAIHSYSYAQTEAIMQNMIMDAYRKGAIQIADKSKNHYLIGDYNFVLKFSQNNIYAVVITVVTMYKDYEYAENIHSTP